MLRTVAVSNAALLLITAADGIPEAINALLSGAKKVNLKVLSLNKEPKPALAIAALKILKFGSLLIRVFSVEPEGAVTGKVLSTISSNSLLHACNTISAATPTVKNLFVLFINDIEWVFIDNWLENIVTVADIIHPTYGWIAGSVSIILV